MQRGPQGLRDADVAQQAERGHATAEATSSRLVIRSTSGVSLHTTNRARVCAATVGCARPWPGFVRRDHIRRDARAAGTAEVDFPFALVAQQEEQPPCKRQAARSSRRRGHHAISCRVRLVARTLVFQAGDAGSIPARDANKPGAFVEQGAQSAFPRECLHNPSWMPAFGFGARCKAQTAAIRRCIARICNAADRVKAEMRAPRGVVQTLPRPEGGNRPQRLGGAGTRDRMEKRSLVNSAVRVPACLVGSRGFESRTRRQ